MKYVEFFYKFYTQNALNEALLNAVKSGDLETVNATLASGAACDFKDESGKTALHWAAHTGPLEIMMAIWNKLPEETAFKSKDNYGGTPLLEAAGNGQREIVLAILDKLLKKEDYTSSIMFMAAYNGHLNVMQAIWDKIPQDSAYNLAHKGNFPLHVAAFNGHAHVMQAILDKLSAEGCNLQNEGGNTALHAAAVNGYVKVARELLSREAIDVNIRNKKDETALYVAAFHYRSNDKTGVVNALLEREDVEINNVGPYSLLTFFEHEHNIAGKLRARGCLESRKAPQTANAPLVQSVQGVHAGETEVTVKESADKLLKRITQETAEAAYVAFKAYCQEDNPAWPEDLKAISLDEHTFSRPLIVKEVSGKPMDERLDFFKAAIKDKFEEMESYSISKEYRDNFRLYCGLLWHDLTTPEAQSKFNDLSGQKQDSPEYAQKLQKVRNHLFETLIESRYEYDGEYDDYGTFYKYSTLKQCRSACAGGTCNFVITGFSDRHEEIKVRERKPSQEYNHVGPLKERMMAKMYELMMQAYTLDPTLMENILDRMTGGIGDVPLTPQTIQNFMRQGDALEDTALIGKFLGLMKKTVIEHAWLYGGLPGDARTVLKEAYMAIEDAIKETTPPDTLYTALMEAHKQAWREKVRTGACDLSQLSRDARLEIKVAFENINVEEEAWFTALDAKAQEDVCVILGRSVKPILSSVASGVTPGYKNIKNAGLAAFAAFTEISSKKRLR